MAVIVAGTRWSRGRTAPCERHVELDARQRSVPKLAGYTVLFTTATTFIAQLVKAQTAVRLEERVLCFGLLHHSHLHTIRDACYGLEEMQGAALIDTNGAPAAPSVSSLARAKRSLDVPRGQSVLSQAISS
jgi:hypothetical protein